MNDQRLKFGLVGAGAIAQSYVQAFERCESARLVAVADIRKEAARALAHGARCEHHTSYQAIATSKLDAVIICTPPDTHPGICLYFLERKVHVLCEKPLSVELKAAKLM